MRKLSNGKPLLPYNEYIVIWGQPSELKHLSNWRKRKKNSITLVVASETVIAQTSLRTGVVGHHN